MDLTKKETENALRFPRSVYIVIIYQYCLRFSFNSLKYTLPFYLLDVLHCEENEATVYFHTFNIVNFFGSMLGGIISDSWLGKFKSILYFTALFEIGLVLLSLSAVPMLGFPIKEVTVLALSFAAIGNGCVRTCIPAFGGDQFILPQQVKQLPKLFVLISISLNLGSLSASFITPVLRKDLTCFSGLTCYSLAFVVPAIVITLAGLMVLVGKKWYRVQKPTSNIVITASNCVVYALYQRIKARKRQQHWLDYAADKYDLKLIEDIKSISQILKLFLPLAVFWALFSQQSSTWLFQSSRMNGEFAGYIIKPDQIQIVNPLFVIICVPIFYSHIYPALDKYTFINTPLRKLCGGALITAFSFYISGIIELNLEPTYAATPVKDYAQLRIYNTLNCNVSMTIDENRLVVEKLNMWKNISIPAKGKRLLKYKTDYSDCKSFDPLSKLNSGILEVVENQATSWAITKEGLSYKFTDDVDKSTSGNPLIRALIYVDEDFTESHATFNLVHNQEISTTISLSKSLQETNLIEVVQKSYDLFLNDQLVESNVVLRLGGIYTVVGHASNSNLTTVAHIVTVTNPNTVHIFWILPQQIVFSISEIMVEVLMMEFVFSQAPVSMKVLVQSFWLFTAVFGNLIVILIIEAQFFERKVFEIFLNAVLMTISSIIFAFLSMSYRYKEDSECDLDRPGDSSESIKVSIKEN